MPKYYYPMRRRSFGLRSAAGGGPPPSIGLQKYYQGMEREQMEFATGLETEQAKELMGHKYKIERGVLQQEHQREAIHARGGMMEHEEEGVVSTITRGLRDGTWEFPESTTSTEWEKLEQKLARIYSDPWLEEEGGVEEAVAEVRRRQKKLLKVARPSGQEERLKAEIQEAQDLAAKGLQRDPKSGTLVPTATSPTEQQEERDWTLEERQQKRSEWREKRFERARKILIDAQSEGEKKEPSVEAIKAVVTQIEEGAKEEQDEARIGQEPSTRPPASWRKLR